MSTRHTQTCAISLSTANKATPPALLGIHRILAQTRQVAHVCKQLSSLFHAVLLLAGLSSSIIALIGVDKARKYHVSPRIGSASSPKCRALGERYDDGEQLQNAKQCYGKVSCNGITGFTDGWRSLGIFSAIRLWSGCLRARAITAPFRHPSRRPSFGRDLFALRIWPLPVKYC